MTENEKERLSDELKEALRIHLPEEVLYYEKEEGALGFLDDLLIEEDEVADIRNDYERLFPYAKGKELSFEGIGHVGGNLVYLDVLDLGKPVKPLSPLAVGQYEDWLRKGCEKENIPMEHFPWISDHFHSLVEKLLFIEFLRNERHLKDKAIRFDIAEIFFDDQKEGSYSLYSKINYVERTVLERFVEKIGTVEKGTSKELRLVVVMQ